MGVVILVAVIVFTPVFLIMWNHYRCAGKMLCFFLEDDLSTRPELLKVEGDFVISHEGAYDVDSDRVRWTRYPAGWPRFLQENIPCALYERGNGLPLDWSRLDVSSVAAKEIGAVLDPEWLKALVKGVREEAGIGKKERMILYIGVGLSALCLIMIFVVMTRLGG